MANQDVAAIARVLGSEGPFRADARLEVYRLSYGAATGEPDPFGFDFAWLRDVRNAGFDVVEVADGYEMQRLSTAKGGRVAP